MKEEANSCNQRSCRLLEDLIGLNQQESNTVTLDWIQAAQAMVHRVGKIMAEPGFDQVRASVQVHQYRSELLRMKSTLERGQQQLLLQRRALQSETDHLKRVKELAEAIRGVQ